MRKIECPVCEKEFARDEGQECEHKQAAYYLCSLECKQEFEDHPNNYIERD